MNIPQSVGFTTNQATPFYFLPDSENTLMIKNIIIHNEHTGNQTIHLCYKNGIGTVLDFYSATVASKTSTIFNDIIICNVGDSVGVYGDGNSYNVLANFVIM
jgi:hypothetical protein